MATVLVVEDDVFINMEAIFIVGELGHTTLCAHDVDQALAFLQGDTHIDVLFTDIRLKDRHLGGYELAMQAAVLRANIRVLYASGGKPAEVSCGLMLLGSHFLQKPYGDMQVQAALAKTLLAAPARLPSV